MTTGPYNGPAGLILTREELDTLKTLLVHANTDDGQAIRERIRRWFEEYGNQTN